MIERRGSKLRAVGGGVVRTPAGQAIEQRLATLFADIEAVIEEHAPDAVAIEDLYFGQNTTSAFAVGQARGVVLLAAGRRGLDCASYTPQQVKQSVCGHGRADKGQVARMVISQLHLEGSVMPDHASDALAVGVCHINHAPLAAAMAAAR